MRWELLLSHFWNEKTRLREAKSSPHVTQQPWSWDWRPGSLASGEGRLEVARLGWGGEALRGGGDRRKQTPPGKGEEGSRVWPGWKGSGPRWWEVGRTTPHGPWWPWCVVGTYGESTGESQKDIYTVQDQTGFLEGEGRLVFRQNSPLCTGLVLRGNPSAQLPGPREAHAGLLPASWARLAPAAVSPSPQPQGSTPRCLTFIPQRLNQFLINSL